MRNQVFENTESKCRLTIAFPDTVTRDDAQKYVDQYVPGFTLVPAVQSATPMIVCDERNRTVDDGQKNNTDIVSIDVGESGESDDVEF